MWVSQARLPSTEAEKEAEVEAVAVVGVGSEVVAGPGLEPGRARRTQHRHAVSHGLALENLVTSRCLL